MFSRTKPITWISFVPYTLLIIFLLFLSISGRVILTQNPDLVQIDEFQVFALGSILFVGFLINRVAPRTIIPSFVWVILAGIALEPVLGVFTRDMGALAIVMELFAAIILFTGGVEIPFKNFKKWFFPIASLSIVGVLLTAVSFSVMMWGLTSALGIFEPAIIPSIVILSVALASTDPTAIIPLLNVMKFKRNYVKEIAISESALTDISGSILTRFLLLAFITTPIFNSNVFNYFSPLLERGTYDAFALQIMSGILVGYLGYSLLKRLYDLNSNRRHADPALLLSVPIFTFVLGNALGGAGFLAAFVAGLLSDLSGELRRASQFNENLLNHLIYPFVFIILGALVPVQTLIEYAPIGIVASVLFILIIRPIVVFCSLFPWYLEHRFKFEDLVFLSMIRETGIIAAVLIVIASSYNIIQSDFVIAIGMWVILLTLILEPPLTPILAKRIGITKK